MSKEDLLRHAQQILISVGELESLVGTLDSLSDEELSEVQTAVKRLKGNRMAEAIQGAWALRNVQFGAWLRRTHQLTESQIAALEKDAEKWRQWRDAFERERLSK